MNKTNTSILSISGESGGGQLLRSSLSLALVTGRAFRITNIRGKRPKPGLMRQHLTCVKAAAEVCGAGVEGAEMGSTELVFTPGKIAAGDYRFAGLPAGDGNDRYLVSLAAPASAVRLTTETGDTTALAVVNTTNSLGNTLSAYQTLAIVPVRDNIDFAFETTVVRDFGDLPSSYGTTVADTPTGPRHYVKVTPTSILGRVSIPRPTASPPRTPPATAAASSAPDFRSSARPATTRAALPGTYQRW